MEIKFTFPSLARAFARSVLPVPGGPVKRIPLGGVSLARSNSFSYLRGHSTASWSCLFTSSSPPTSPHPTSGTSTNTSLMAVGSISLRACRKCSIPTLRLRRVSVGMWAFWKSISGMTCRRQLMAASRQRACKSAPTKPWVISASFVRSTSSARGMPLECISSTLSLAFLSGMGMVISLSKRPGRLRAGSREWGMLVAAMTMTCPLSLRPSMRASSWATTLFSTSPKTCSLLGAMASTSSRNIMAGVFLLASSKISLSLASLSP